MVTHPANMVMTIIPRAVAALSGFERIQAFLLRPSLEDARMLLPRSDIFDEKRDAGIAIRLQQVRIGHETTIQGNVNLEIPLGSFTIISGSTGSGKSVLLRAMLGEVPSITGSIALSTRRIAYCAQSVWLPNGTIKAVIQGDDPPSGIMGREDEAWYREVIRTCCLTQDVDSLPNGDKSLVGTRGMNLSGGQRQRVVCLWARLLKVHTDNRRHSHAHCLRSAT